MYVIGKKAPDEGFEFMVRKSTTLRFDVICKIAECKWKIISSKSKNGDSWLLGTVNDIHTCSRTQLNPNHRNATKKLLGWLLAPKLKDYSRIYKPKDIINDINLEFNIDITYKKAWGGKNKGLEINSGCPLDSFSQLPYYFYNLKMANEGTVMHIENDDEGRFKMCFIAFGFAIRSFLTHVQPLLIIDGAHLKGTYKGTNLVLVGMDGNNQIVPIATGVSQGETGESWTWFLLKFKECIGEVPNLAIITDRHPAIILACNTIFPNAFHGYCCRHLMMNCKMKSDKLQEIYWKTCKAYTPEEFQRRVSDLRSFRLEAYKKLEVAGFEIWSRAMCLADRYIYMTSNSPESINNLTRHVRKVPIMQLMETTCHEPIANYQDSTQPRLKRSRQTRQESNIHVDLGGHSQEYEAAYTNNYVRSQEYEAAYTNNYVRSQEYEAVYTNNYVRSQEYEAAYTNNCVSTQEYEAAYNNMVGGSQGYRSTYNSMNGSSQGYEAAYTNFNNMIEQANINFGGQSQHLLPTMSFTFSQFNLGQSSQQTYSTWDSSWDPINLADP
ncbi:transposase, MuDR, MULE transposase domain protein [Tanacetum coccineum]